MPRYLPKSVVCLREGYDRRTVLADLLAGVTVGIIALPLAMAFGIASIPEKVAAEAGVSPPAMASLLFMKRMADVSNITREFANGDDELEKLKDPNAVATRDVPPGVEVYEINGPFFFGVADRLQDTLRSLERPPKVFILRMRRVPAIHASGLHALSEFHRRCQQQGTALLLSGVHAQPLFAFTGVGFDRQVGSENMFGDLDTALERAREIVGVPPEPRPEGAVAEVKRDQRKPRAAG